MSINIGFQDVLLISPLIVLFLFSIIPITAKVLRGNKEQVELATLVQGLLGFISSAALLAFFAGSGKTAFANALVFDGVTLWFGLIALVISAGALLLVYENPSLRGPQFSEIMFLIMSSALGMLILVSAIDFLMMFIGLETMSLALYLLIAMSNEQKISKEAAFKYFVLGGFASAIFLYGAALVFGTSGTTFIPDIVSKTPELIATSKLFLFGICFMILGFAFKVSIVPFHAWTPDVYQGAPTPITAYMATAIKAVSFAAFLRLIATKVLVGNENLLDMLQWLAVITMTVGNVAAIIQNNFKRMLAYSSVAHSGYILVGVITTGISGNAVFGASSVTFYILAYSLMTLGSFAIVSMMEKTENTSLSIDEMAGFAKKNPMMALCLSIFLLSLAGVPPLIGFWGKFYLFNAAIGEGLIWLAVWGVLNSVISVYYYLRPIVVMYMKEGDVEVPHPVFSTRLLIGFIAILVVVLGLISGGIFSAFEKSIF